VAKRVGENYKPPPKRPLAAFSGSGNRLGSPVPGTATTEGPSGSMPGAFSTGSGGGSGASAPQAGEGLKFEVDQSLPTTSVQVRLADGTR